MNNYVQVSCDLYDMFEEASTNKVDCEITFVKDNKELTINTKIINLKSVSGSEFMETENGIVIRLDKIVKFNGKATASVNYY